MDTDISMLLTRCIVCPGSEPQDPEYPRLKPVGVYPVEGGWARIRLEDVAGKGEEGYSALYVVPGEGVRIEKACVGVKMFCQMRLAVPQKLSLISCQRVPAEVVCPSGAGTAMMRWLGFGLQRRLHSLRFAQSP